MIGTVGIDFSSSIARSLIRIEALGRSLRRIGISRAIQILPTPTRRFIRSISSITTLMREDSEMKRVAHGIVDLLAIACLMNLIDRTIARPYLQPFNAFL